MSVNIKQGSYQLSLAGFTKLFQLAEAEGQFSVKLSDQPAEKDDDQTAA
ncbi:hypothetical protein KO516_06895 [Citreicella sp. C3M06]|nr:hypothetical protein [Citreicella sp. C3M06]